MTIDIARLFRIERKKLFPYRAFNVMVALLGLLFVLGVLFFSSVLYDIFASMTSIKDEFSKLRTNLPWNIVTYFAGYFNMLLSYALILFVCNEYGYRTLRQNIIDGLRPEETLLGKYLVAVLISVSAVVVVGLMALYFEVQVRKQATMPLGLHYLGLYAVQLISTLLVAIFFATWMRKTGLAVLLFAAFWYLIDPLMYYWVLPNEAAVFLPASAIKDLVHLPGLDELVQRNNGLDFGQKELLSKFHLNLKYGQTLLTVLVWDVVVVVATLRLLRKRDF